MQPQQINGPQYQQLIRQQQQQHQQQHHQEQQPVEDTNIYMNSCCRGGNSHVYTNDTVSVLCK